MSLRFITFLLVIFGWSFAQAQNPEIPNAQPGKCYAKCLIGDQYETTTEQIMVKPASKKS
ncbi:MAG: hypothetical protein IPK61_14180 [Saprospiraceae bacterium]|nr:hypothetical protein [Saprospiraceae bacterium]